MTNKIESSISNLDPALMRHVLSYTSTQDLSHLTATQKRFSHLMKDKDLWRMIYKKIEFLDAIEDLNSDPNLDLNQFNKERIKIIQAKESIDQLTDDQFIERIKLKKFPFLTDIVTYRYAHLFESIIKRDKSRVLNLSLTSHLLIEAAYQNSNSMVQILIKSGRFADISGYYLGSAFILASGSDHSQIVQTLIESGRFIYISTFALGSAFIQASSIGHLEVVQTLIKSGRFAEIASNHLGSALIQASNSGHTKVVQALIESGRFADISDLNLDLALAGASKGGHNSVIKILSQIQFPLNR